MERYYSGLIQIRDVQIYPSKYIHQIDLSKYIHANISTNYIYQNISIQIYPPIYKSKYIHTNINATKKVCCISGAVSWNEI